MPNKQCYSHQGYEPTIGIGESNSCCFHNTSRFVNFTGSMLLSIIIGGKFQKSVHNMFQKSLCSSMLVC